MKRSRVIGMLRGVAIGDALGVPVETYDAARIRKEFGRITTYLQNPTHKWSKTKPAGMWSDDTQLTLAVAEGIIETGSLDLDAQARWHLRMIDELGDMGLGGSTREAFERLRAGVPPTRSGMTDKPNRGMGNALPMKISPAAPWMLCVINRGEDPVYASAVYDIAALTTMTHHTDVALQSALAHMWALRVCLTSNPGEVNADILVSALQYAIGLSDRFCLPGTDDTLALQLNSLRLLHLDRMTVPELNRHFGRRPFMVADTLPMAYACFLRHPTSVEALYDAVAVGGDTDTNASIAGGLVGALNGPTVFPDHLVQGLAHRERIDDTANRLCDKLGITE